MNAHLIRVVVAATFAASLFFVPAAGALRAGPAAVPITESAADPSVDAVDTGRPAPGEERQARKSVVGVVLMFLVLGGIMALVLAWQRSNTESEWRAAARDSARKLRLTAASAASASSKPTSGELTLVTESVAALTGELARLAAGAPDNMTEVVAQARSSLTDLSAAHQKAVAAFKSGSSSDTEAAACHVTTAADAAVGASSALGAAASRS